MLASCTFKSGGDEHGILLGVPGDQLPVGATLSLVPSHCDPTVNLHDYLVGVTREMAQGSRNLAGIPFDIRTPTPP